MLWRSPDQRERWRHESFVERTREIELFTRILLDEAPHPSVIYVHGPGGIGKTALLWELGHVAKARGAARTHIDARHAAPSPRGFLRALAEALKLGPGEPPLEALGVGAGRHVILLDACEALEELEGWLYDTFVAQLPGRVLLVAASRRAPSLILRRSSGWGLVLRPLALGTLGDAAAAAYLERRGVAPDQRGAVLAFSHGHPLALSLCADAVTFGPTRAFAPSPPPDVIHALMTHLIEQAPTAEQRAALDVCALLRTTTEPVLAAVLGSPGSQPVAHPAAAELFEWLRGLSFIESGPCGLSPHDLAREVLVADLRWRNPPRFSELFTRAAAHAEATAASSTPVATDVILDREAFGEALRGALRDVCRPRYLSGSPLLCTPLMARRVAPVASAEQRAAALLAMIREGIASLRGGRRGERLHRVLETTYRCPGLTQAQAAAELGLPFSTYRRHLKEAMEALEDLLWQEDRRAPR